jgi:hypothetical protein
MKLLLSIFFWSVFEELKLESSRLDSLSLWSYLYFNIE